MVSFHAFYLRRSFSFLIFLMDSPLSFRHPHYCSQAELFLFYLGKCIVRVHYLLDNADILIWFFFLHALIWGPQRPSNIQHQIMKWNDCGCTLMCRALWHSGESTTLSVKRTQVHILRYHFKPSTVSFTLHCFSSLNSMNEYLAIYSGGYECVRMLLL